MKLKVLPHGGVFPDALSLAPLPPNVRVDSAWLVGHPWGIGLTLAKPADGYVKVDGKHHVQHNILTTPANSGGPILNQRNEVIALVSGGRGDDFKARGFKVWGGGLADIVPDPIPAQIEGYETYNNGVMVNDFYALTCPTGRFVLACEVVRIPTPPVGALTSLTIQIAYGDGGEPAAWQRYVLEPNLTIPATGLIRVNQPFQQIAGQTWQSSIRALEFIYHYTPPGGAAVAAPAPAAPAAGGRAANRNVSMGAVQADVANSAEIKDLVFGCFGTGSGADLTRWTILHRGDGPALIPGHPTFRNMPMFLGQDWKNPVNGYIGPLNVADPALAAM